MYYKTESVIVPDLNLMKREFEIIDKIESYSRLLVEHSRSPGQLDSMPIPLFVLKKIYEKQYKIRSAGFPDIMDIARCLGDVACVLHLNTNTERISLNRPKIFKNFTFEGTFLYCQNSTRSNLLDIIRKHMDIISKLDNKQKVYVQLHQKLGLCEDRFRETQKKISSNDISIMLKMQNYLFSKRVEQMTDKDRKEHERLEELIARAADYKDDIKKIAKQMEMDILRNIKDRLSTIQDNLKTVLTNCEITDKTKPVEYAVDSLCTSINTKAFYDNFSQHYNYPDVKDLLLELENTVDLPKPILRDPKVPSSCLETDDFQHNSDTCCNLYAPACYSTVIVMPRSRPLNGIINNEQEIRVKCKLWLMAKSVGFCWYRKHACSRKTWGLIKVAR